MAGCSTSFAVHQLDSPSAAAAGPVWSPDGTRVVYSSPVNGVNNLHLIDAGGGGKPEQLLTNANGQTAMSWSRAANAVAFLQRTNSGADEIGVLPMEGDRTPRVFVESTFMLWQPEFSPDGRLMAYASNESGAFEVYVQPYPAPGRKRGSRLLLEASRFGVPMDVSCFTDRARRIATRSFRRPFDRCRPSASIRPT